MYASRGQGEFGFRRFDPEGANERAAGDWHKEGGQNSGLTPDIPLQPAPKTEEAMMHEVFLYTDRVVSMVRPRKLLVMAIDGVAPRAKMNQQRSRRFRSAEEARVKEEERLKAIEEWEGEFARAELSMGGKNLQGGKEARADDCLYLNAILQPWARKYRTNSEMKRDGIPTPSPPALPSWTFWPRV